MASDYVSDSSSPRQRIPKIAMGKVASAAGWVLFILAVIVLTAWAFDLRGLESFVPESAGMKANSAVAMMLASFALLRRNHRDLPLYSLAVFLIGALTLGEYLWKINIGIDEILFRDTHYFFYPGRMSQYTSIGFMLLGLSLLPMTSRHRAMRQFSRGLGIFTGALGALAIVSHSYNTRAVDLIAPQNNVSIPTALCFLIAAIGIQYANPSEGIVRLFHADNAGGMALRHLLPIGLVVMLLCGLAVRDAQRHYHWENGFSLALVGLGVGACLLSGIVLVATALEREDLARRESERLFLLAAKTAPVMIWMSGTDKLCNYFSEPWLKFTGRSKEEEMGNGWAAGVHPDDLEQCMTTYSNSFDWRVPFQMQYRLRRHDGEYRWIFDTGVARFDENGSFIGYIGSCVDITEQKLAEEALLTMNRTLEEQGSLLRSREELLSEFVKSVPAAVAMLDRDMCYLQVSDRWCIDYPPSREEITGRSHYEIFPDMPERWKEVHRRALQGETLRADEDRWEGRDGTHWARWEVRPWKTPDGAVGGILILAEDITGRKAAEEALNRLSGQLIQAQEQERHRIAREIHDDFQQRLALLSIDLDNIARDLGQDETAASDKLRELWNSVGELCSDLHFLSHRLHSSTLESLGLSAALTAMCEEFKDHHQIDITFIEENVPRQIPNDAALCLFRVAQEALQNIQKHSGAKAAEVRLEGLEDNVHLSICDQGNGFDATNGARHRGIGIRSMEERLHLLKGTLAIQSRPMEGTRVDAWVPVEVARAAGFSS